MVTVTSNNENPHVGDDIILTCIIELDSAVDTDVMVTTFWSGPEGAPTGTTPIDQDSDGTYESTLTLTSLKTIDSGNYTCTAEANSVDMFITASVSVSDKLMITFGKEYVDM